MKQMQRVALGLGSNLGDRLGELQAGLDGWTSVAASRIVAVSGVYESAAVGGPAQPDFLNSVAILETELSPSQVLRAAWGIERDRQRVRTVRWGPRTLDIDLLSYGAVTMDRTQLVLPHPMARQRWFVLLPWSEVDGDYLIPGRGDESDITVMAALDALGRVDPAGRGSCLLRADLKLRIGRSNTLEL